MKRLLTGIVLVGVGVALLGATPAPAPTPTASPTVDFEAGWNHENLTNGFPPWDSQYLLITKRYNQRVSYALIEAINRFSKHDDQITAGMYLPLSAKWAGTLEASASPAHRIVPSYSVAAGAQFGSGLWYEGLTLRHTSYNAASVNSAVLGIEHYWKAYRIVYQLTAAHLAATGTDVEHALEVDRYYGERSSFVGLGYTTGREVENVGLPALLVSNVNGWKLTGRHWASQHWAVVYGLQSFTQGTSYTRSGGHLGLDYRL